MCKEWICLPLTITNLAIIIQASISCFLRVKADNYPSEIKSIVWFKKFPLGCVHIPCITILSCIFISSPASVHNMEFRHVQRRLYIFLKKGDSLVSAWLAEVCCQPCWPLAWCLQLILPFMLNLEFWNHSQFFGLTYYSPWVLASSPLTGSVTTQLSLAVRSISLYLVSSAASGMSSIPSFCCEDTSLALIH